MAGTVEQSTYFTERRKRGLPIITELPKFDLESYIANYEGHVRVQRLKYIAQQSPPLAVEALHLAIPSAKNGKDTGLYIGLTNLLESIDSSDALAVPDMDWVERANKLNEQESDRLEHELRGYKNNLIKESIRMGQEDLGTHFLSIANLESSSKAYQKMREYCTTPKHIAEMNVKLMYANVLAHQWLLVLSSHSKMRQLTLKTEDRTRFESAAQVCTGLANLCQGNYRAAAACFLDIDPTFSTAGPVAGIDFSRAVLTANDIAVYGGLCALASMTRDELQTQVLDNASFRNFLELEPHIRRAISFFCGAKYSACLAVLEAYRADYLLDLFLGAHVVPLFTMIRSTSIVQYFLPFSSVTLDALAAAFPRPGTETTNSSNAAAAAQAMEAELTDMIARRVLDARIDTVERTLVAPPRDLRADAHAEAMQAADEVEHLLRLKLHRVNMMQAGLEVQAVKGSGGGGGKGKGVGVGGAGWSSGAGL